MPVDGSAVGTLFRVHKSFLPSPATRAPRLFGVVKAGVKAEMSSDSYTGLAKREVWCKKQVPPPTLAS